MPAAGPIGLGKAYIGAYIGVQIFVKVYKNLLKVYKKPAKKLKFGQIKPKLGQNMGF